MIKILIRLGIIPLSLIAGAAHAADIKVIAANAVKEGYTEIVAAFEKVSGHKVITTWSGTVATEKRVGAGEVFDVVLIGNDAIERLVKDGKLAAAGRVDFAKTGIGIAVRDGLPKPGVSTPESIKAAVLAARSISYSAGPSGAYIASLFTKWGVADQVAAKVKQPSSGAEAVQLLARGETELAFAQVSELRGIAGIQDLGPIPSEIQNFTVYSAAQHPMSAVPDVAALLLNALKSPDGAAAIRKMGMEPG